MLYLSLHLYDPSSKPLGAIVIQNDGHDDIVTGNFHIELYDKEGKATKQLRIEKFPLNKGDWALAREALIALKIDEA